MSMLNHLLPKGGVKEVRILDMDIPSVKDTIAQLKILHDYKDIKLVKIDDLFVTDDEPIEVLAFLTTSFDDFAEFSSSVFLLSKMVFGVMEKSAVENLKIIFGDNYRGLIQQAMFGKLNSQKKITLQLTTVSTVFQTSNYLDSTESDNKFRCYPKTDGSYYLYNPGVEMDETSTENLMDELKEKISPMETVFKPGQNGSSYSAIEGFAIARFLQVYLQNGWEIALRNEGLFGRLPSKKEADHYGLEPTLPIFLPPLANPMEEEEEDDRLPVLVDQHIKEASIFVGEALKKVEK